MKIFSFCIYGDDIKYYLGLRENIRIIIEFFPEYHIFIYAGSNRLDGFLNRLKDNKINIIDTGKEGIINTIYRYSPILEKEVECVIIRDTDSEVNARDRWTINDFLNEDNNNSSKKSVQVIRDHIWHKSKIMGGLTTFKKSDTLVIVGKELKSIFMDLNKGNIPIDYGFEEKLLSQRIYPIIKDEILVYSNICVFKNEEYRNIDFENNGENFCGNVVIYEKQESENSTDDFIENYNYKKKHQFNYFYYNILKHIYWLAEQSHLELIISCVDEFGFHRIPFEQKSHILDYYIFSLINRKSFDCILECFTKYQEFAKYNITSGVKTQIPAFFNMVRSLGYSIIGTCDTDYQPNLMEFVIYFGNYPDDFMSLPQSFRIYRHFLFFKDIELDRFISNKCWDNIDRIFIMGIENGCERINNTWMHLCSMNAPLDRIEEYRAKKDADLKDIYIGATKNHLDCLEIMYNNSYNNCLFLEDDFVFTSNIRENQKSLFKFFENDYDYNICFLSASKFHERKEYDDLLLLSKQICTTSSGYLVSKKNIELVLNTVKEGYELLMKYPDQSHIYCIDRFWTKLDKLFIFKKKLGFQSPSLSKITGRMNNELD
jgi:hypothetical protein